MIPAEIIFIPFLAYVWWRQTHPRIEKVTLHNVGAFSERMRQENVRLIERTSPTFYDWQERNWL